MANLIPFTKRFESSENLVNLLESRGLQICDRNKAIQYLDNIGYYRLSAYMYPLLKMPKIVHLYKEGSTFEKVMMLYRFDKKLRLLMFNEIEKIEIAIRRAVMQITSDMTDNPFWLTDSSYFLDSSRFNETMRAISKEYSKSKEEFILHFKRTYSEPYPPSWILGELLTLIFVSSSTFLMLYPPIMICNPTWLRGKILGMFFLFHSILYLCIMNMLEQLARIVLPKEILDNFDIVKIETDESDIDSMSMTIYLDERMNAYLQKSEDYESKGFMDAVRITDFPIRDHKVILVLRRRRWKNKETGETFVDRISVTESGTRYSKEFAAFLKETYGHIPDDLPYA